MTVAAAVLAPFTAVGSAPGLRAAAEAALSAGADETLVVVAGAELARVVPDDATVLLDDASVPDEASAARVALDWAARAGHGAAVVAYGDLRRGAAGEREAWAALVTVAAGEPVLVGIRRRRPTGLVRLEASIWSLLPLSGSLEVLWRARPELAGDLELGAPSQ